MEDAKDFAEDNNLAFIETSALDATNIDLAFEVGSGVYMCMCACMCMCAGLGGGLG